MLTITLIITGVVFALAALFLRFAPPKKKNLLIGYRTFRSMRSQEAWDFSQKYSGKQMLRTGTVLIVIGASAFFWPPVAYWLEFGLTMFFILAVAILPIILTEHVLKKKFESAAKSD